MDLKSAASVLRTIPISVATTDELACYLRCSRRTIERLVHRGVLHPIRVGRCWRFDREQVFAALNSIQ
jgi:excisionase family DNA binding protein